MDSKNESEGKYCGCEHHCHCDDTECSDGEVLHACLQCLLADLHSLPIDVRLSNNMR